MAMLIDLPGGGLGTRLPGTPGGFRMGRPGIGRP
ncbi:hypothetical protein SAVERM_1p85 (plasmid) [Streptomyces avermitilis MA-4680 = NBRC 14893]|uniref:Uncharacterized protein n=1 Tax=Streptomyces avermitilis (strain ATCC 31267 / DSM 46492 / JCM 5070 / NBRC 14893 / NCIMB 12804 / NRRL 8165 / MA-4680) TaxID=227882 RepID=Q82Y96_STRAW|nr:hypothetical protein SAVERM_1p85 [Streptomyces avermitilis MA-4680 = NBRC 14893]